MQKVQLPSNYCHYNDLRHWLSHWRLTGDSKSGRAPWPGQLRCFESNSVCQEVESGPIQTANPGCIGGPFRLVELCSPTKRGSRKFAQRSLCRPLSLNSQCRLSWNHRITPRRSSRRTRAVARRVFGLPRYHRSGAFDLRHSWTLPANANLSATNEGKGQSAVSISFDMAAVLPPRPEVTLDIRWCKAMDYSSKISAPIPRKRVLRTAFRASPWSLQP